MNYCLAINRGSLLVAAPGVELHRRNEGILLIFKSIPSLADFSVV